MLAGFVLALPAAAESQNSSTLQAEPVSDIATDQATSSCGSARTLLGSPSSALGGDGVAFSTPVDVAPLAMFQRAGPMGGCHGTCSGSVSSYSCQGTPTGGRCIEGRSYGRCVGVKIEGSSDCDCFCRYRCAGRFCD